jgi:hypothetical protein
MFFEEVEASTKGVKALEARAYSPTYSRAKLRWKQWGTEWEKKNEAS